MKKLFMIYFLLWLVLTPLGLIFWVTQPLFFDTPKAMNVHKIDESKLKIDVEVLSTKFSKRNFTNIETLNDAAKYIENELSLLSNNTYRQNYKVDNETVSNIIAHFGPNDGEPIIVGAHYDAFEETSGADDNASGIAGLLALAKLLHQYPPKIPVDIVAYTLEEPPIFRTNEMGSRQHAQLLISKGIKPSLVMVLEMIGYFNDNDGSQEYPIKQLNWFYPDKGNFIAVVGNFTGVRETRLVKSAMQSASDLPVTSINAPSLLTGIDFSDHASYWLHNIPAVMITNTSFYRNANYHRSTDTSEKLDYTRMAKVIQGVYEVIKIKEFNYLNKNK